MNFNPGGERESPWRLDALPRARTQVGDTCAKHPEVRGWKKVIEEEKTRTLVVRINSCSMRLLLTQGQPSPAINPIKIMHDTRVFRVWRM